MRMSIGLLFFMFHSSLLFAAVSMNPAIEGMYQISITCASPSPSCDASNLSSVDRLSVVNTPGGKYGLWISLASATDGDYIGTFVSVQVGPSPNQLTGLPVTGMSSGESGGPFSYVTFTIDPTTGNLDGTIADSLVASPFKLVGKKIYTIGQLIGPASNITLDQIAGSYKGTMAGDLGILLITVLPDQELTASFTNIDKQNGMPLFNISFSDVIWNPQTGVLRLLFSNPRFFAIGELAVTIQIKAGKLHLDGFEFSLFNGGPVAMDHS